MHGDFIHLADDDGVILRRDIVAVGGDDRTISRALRHGQIVRIRNGAYALRSIWETYDARKRYLVTVRVAYGASKTAVAVSHTSALALLGGPTWEIPLTDVHLTRLDGRAGRREAGVVQHRGALDREDVTIVAGMCVTSATRTALDMTTLVGMERSVPVLDHLSPHQADDQARAAPWGRPRCDSGPTPWARIWPSRSPMGGESPSRRAGRRSCCVAADVRCQSRST